MVSVEHVYSLYKWYKNELIKYFGKLPQSDWQVLIRFFNTKENVQEAWDVLLKQIPPEDHAIIIAKVFNIPQNAAEIIAICENFKLENEPLRTIFKLSWEEDSPQRLDVVPTAITDDELDWLSQFYQQATKEHIEKIYLWAHTKEKYIPYVIDLIIALYFDQPAKVLAWMVPWYYKITNRILFFINGELKGLTVEEFIKTFPKEA